ncbi:MAG: DUF4870 domain-containing protein [Stappiaceae bacterium]
MTNEPQNSPNDFTGTYIEPGSENIQLVYILYLVGLAVGLTSIIGVIMAYLNRGKSSGWVESHYTYQIRTFWLGFLYSLISVALMFLVIGFVTIFLTVIWYIVRCIKGMQYSSRKEMVPNPETYLW